MVNKDDYNSTARANYNVSAMVEQRADLSGS